jgi:hypothetical protein
MTENISPYSDLRAPDLRIVAVNSLLPHEIHDEQRSAPLVRRLPLDGTLMNPPVVTQMDDGRFVILDGANRITAFEMLGYPHILVQVVPYQQPVVELQTWYHVVSGIDGEKLASRFIEIPELEQQETSIFHAQALLAQRAVLVYYLLSDGRVFTLAGRGLDVRERTRLLIEIVQKYLHKGRLNRTNTDDIDSLRTLYPEMSLAVIFPRYEPVEILDLALEGLPLPPGITRHVVHGRALRLHYPLERLTEAKSLEEKNIDLNHWIQERFEKRVVRFYAESTYLFDE